jgi:parallel beta-helix repeat protein
MKRLAPLALLGVLGLGAPAADATDISGTISATMTITEDSQLIGDVTCTVTGANCIQFGAPNITLSLNGFTMTGQGLRDSCPTNMAGENGISTNSQDGVSILGPGLIRRFRRNGIVVTGSSSLVTHLVVASVCQNAISVQGSANGVVTNTFTRFSLAGAFFTGIAVLGTGGHSILKNEVIGGSDLAAQGFSRGGHGIYVLPASTGNTIKRNSASGNPGVGIWLDTGTTGNKIVRNVAIGNLVAQDIFDNNASGANTYSINLCEESFGTGAPTCPSLPDIAGFSRAD